MGIEGTAHMASWMKGSVVFLSTWRSQLYREWEEERSAKKSKSVRVKIDILHFIPSCNITGAIPDVNDRRLTLFQPLAFCLEDNCFKESLYLYVGGRNSC